MSYAISFAVFGFIGLALFLYAFVYNRFNNNQAEGRQRGPIDLANVDVGERRGGQRRRQVRRQAIGKLL